ncbi:hypothetical protein [Pseudomonas sp. 6D_7.1_Bac1]|uniref:hypothetical protein n=1 Tax=Pseudomonas sp. 6D_7.1_Bac1 TaxID=2971615 RepID=UPI0021C844C0|nr:hypothetical protein [Pseudomonas sp. 6D_7.1_Bac1]MCU1748805.1 hypothetical protein [Pseudomonas sp. 6D_7.1_Bac1]
MKFPTALAALESISTLERSGGRWLITLSGVPGWCWEYPQGLCVALVIERPLIDDQWLAQLSLWLASVPGSLDDSLLLEGERLLLVRRYESDLASVELQAQINQQLTIARWLAAQGEEQQDSTDTAVAGRWV